MPLALAALYVLSWLAAAATVRDVHDWWLENVVVLAFVPVLVASWRWSRLSNAAYALVFAFLVLHLIGSYFTYVLVPGGWRFFGSERNNYDRVVHLAFGLLVAPVLAEVGERFAGMRRAWPSIVAFLAIGAASAFYEVLEWLSVLIIPAQDVPALLGFQGDIFDTQADMGLAMTGAIVSLVARWLARRGRATGPSSARTSLGRGP